jgi:hypothetical protein
MAIAQVTTETVSKFCSEVAVKHFSGHWCILGSAVVTYLCDGKRITTDMDLCHMDVDAATNDDALSCAMAAEELGLLVESINLAASYFFTKIPAEDRAVVALRTFPHLTLFRPDATTFLCMKIGRLTELDLTDCVFMAEKFPDELRPEVLSRYLRSAAADAHPGKLRRLNLLASSLGLSGTVSAVKFGLSE